MKLLVLVNLLIFIWCNEDLYSKQGENWQGICKTGRFQSPINIVHGLNTRLTNSTTSFDYHIPNGAPKFNYDGDKLYVEVDIGTMRHTYNDNEKRAEEVYRAYKIEIHLPSEHYITVKGKTPRAAVEIQIFHNLESTDNPEATNIVMSVGQSIVSILLDIKGETQDLFLASMGLSGNFFK